MYLLLCAVIVCALCAVPCLRAVCAVLCCWLVLWLILTCVLCALCCVVLCCAVSLCEFTLPIEFLQVCLLCPRIDFVVDIGRYVCAVLCRIFANHVFRHAVGHAVHWRQIVRYRRHSGRIGAFCFAFFFLSEILFTLALFRQFQRSLHDLTLPFATSFPRLRICMAVNLCECVQEDFESRG